MNTESRRIGLTGLLITVPLILGGCKGIVNERAYKQLQAALGATSFTVFPTCVRTGKETSYDAQSAERIAAFLTRAKLGEAAVSEAQVPLPTAWSHNQAAMLRESAAAFAAYLAENPVETEYAAIAEVLRGKPGARAGGIHWYVFDAQGRVAHAKLMNTHYEPFKTAKLDTDESCTEFLIAELRRDFSTHTADDSR